MASPQLENGYFRIANEIIDQFCKSKNRLSGEEWIILWIILRKTYGWHKPEDYISLSQFYQISGMKKPSIIRALKKLEQKRIISKKANGKINKWQFIKDYHQWTLLAKQLIVSKTANPALAKQLHTKDTITKDIYIPKTMKKTNSSSFGEGDEPQINTEGEEVTPTTKASTPVFKIMLWAEKQKGKQFTNRGKQMEHLSKAFKAGYTAKEISQKWLDMSEEEFWLKNGFDFKNVATELDRKL